LSWLWFTLFSQKSLQVRLAEVDIRTEEIKIFYDSHPNSTRKEIAQKFDVSEKTIQRLKLIKRG
jgi:hypothetical protein